MEKPAAKAKSSEAKSKKAATTTGVPAASDQLPEANRRASRRRRSRDWVLAAEAMTSSPLSTLPASRVAQAGNTSSRPLRAARVFARSDVAA